VDGAAAGPLQQRLRQQPVPGLQQFFTWLAAEDELPDPMTGLQPPRVTAKLVPVFTREELARLEQTCSGRSFAQRRDTAIIAVLKAKASGWPSCSRARTEGQILSLTLCTLRARRSA
jgi:site-specific recombinase XerD